MVTSTPCLWPMHDPKQLRDSTAFCAVALLLIVFASGAVERLPLMPAVPWQLQVCAEVRTAPGFGQRLDCTAA